MKKVIVIGGGLSGLASAVLLAKNNCKVTLLESSPKLGGRTYSRYDSKKKFTYDNGQHLLMSCYDHTLQYLKLIGTDNKISVINNIFVQFINRTGESFYLSGESYPYPLNLLKAILTYKALSLSERLSAIKLLVKLKFADLKNLKEITVSEWLINNSQTGNSFQALWEILVLAMLNTSSDIASAGSFAAVLKEIFISRTDGYKFITPQVGLSELLVDDALKFIENREGEIKFSERVQNLFYSDKNISKIETAKGSYENFDYIISAVPIYALYKILPEFRVTGLLKPDYRPILSVFIKTDTKKYKQKYYALLNSPVQWVFVHENKLSIVISNAENLVDYSKDSLEKLIFDEMEIHFKVFKRSDAEEIVIIKEKRATFVPTPEFESARLNIKSPFNNLILAGDWTNTGLPSTIESAVKSGFDAAKQILRQ